MTGQPNHSSDGYEWPTCTACHRDLWHDETGRQVCRPCQDRTITRLRELPALFNRLNTTANHMRGTAPTSGSSTSGTRTPPIPPRLDVLTLTAPGGATRRLQDIEDSWRTALGWDHNPATDPASVRIFAPWRSNPAADVPRHARFLADNLPWACEAYDSVGQDVEEIRRIHADLTRALSGDRRPGRVSIGFCPTPVDDDQQPCGTDLTASTNSPRIQCPTCGTRWETDMEWKRLRSEQQAILDTLEPAA